MSEPHRTLSRIGSALRYSSPIPRRLGCSALLVAWPHRFSKFTIGLVASNLIVFGFLLSPASAQEVDLYTDDPPTLVGSAQRLMLEQVDQMAAEGDVEEAISGLEKLFDQGSGFLVATGAPQRAGTLVTQRFRSLRREVSQRLGQMLQANEAASMEYRRRHDPVALQLLRDLSYEHDLERAEIAALRYADTSSGPGLNRLLTDMYLERGWSLSAMAAVQRFVSELRVQVGLSAAPNSDVASAGKSSQGTLSWPRVWRVNRDEVGEAIDSQFRKRIESVPDGVERLTQALERIALAMEVAPEEIDGPMWMNWLRSLEGVIPSNRLATIEASMKRAGTSFQVRETGEWPAFAGNAARSAGAMDFAGRPERPAWSQRVPLFMASQDLVPASLPRVGEGARETLPYHPVVSGGRMYLNSMTEIQAFELQSGESWPKTNSSRPLFSSGLSSADYLPLGYPLIGTPRATLVVAGERLFARMGDAVTGRANARVGADGGSLSQLVGLDLNRDGSMLPGFPIRLLPPDFENAEFEGSPVVFGDLLLVTVANRDNVGLRRSVAAFDVESGRLRWHSPPLATGMVEGSENANLISHQLLTVSGGRIFYNTNLGNIVCLNPLDGSVLWLTQYRRAPKRTRGIYEPDRFRYRDLNPCLAFQGLVYCAPQDCPEIFALDAATGDLVWASNDAQTQDLVHLIGVTQDSLIASGDRLMWLNRRSGKIQGDRKSVV